MTLPLLLLNRCLRVCFIGRLNASPGTSVVTTAITAVSIVTEQIRSQAGSSLASCLSFSLWQPKWSFATLARPFPDYVYDYAQAEEQPEEASTQVTSAEYQQLLTQGFQPPNPYLQTQAAQPVPAYQHHAFTPMVPSQVSAPEPSYALEQTQMLPSQAQRQMSQVSSSHYATPYESPEMERYQQPAQSSRKRSHQEEYSYDYPGIQQLQAHAAGTGTPVSIELTPHARHAQLQAGTFAYQVPSQRPSPQPSHSAQSFQSMQPQQHHHHRLPNQPPPSKAQRTGYGEASSSAAEDHGPPSVVGQPGMPTPAPKPKGPKLKFTPEDDALLVELKETKNLTWKQIADFFPGRSSGTLQVRYCTKLKAKTTLWTDEMVREDAASEVTEEAG